MKGIINRIDEKNGFILYEKSDYKKCPPLTRYFIICEKIGLYRDIKDRKSAEKLFKILTN